MPWKIPSLGFSNLPPRGVLVSTHAWAPNILCRQKTPETRPLISAFFQRDKLLCRFDLYEKSSFQKPFGRKEAFTKVIVAIEAKDQEHSGLN